MGNHRRRVEKEACGRVELERQHASGRSETGASRTEFRSRRLTSGDGNRENGITSVG
jgi:hypothetical protein